MKALILNEFSFYNNKKFLWGPGAVFSKRAPGRRRQCIENRWRI